MRDRRSRRKHTPVASASPSSSPSSSPLSRMSLPWLLTLGCLAVGVAASALWWSLGVPLVSRGSDGVVVADVAAGVAALHAALDAHDADTTDDAAAAGRLAAVTRLATVLHQAVATDARSQAQAAVRAAGGVAALVHCLDAAEALEVRCAAAAAIADAIRGSEGGREALDAADGVDALVRCCTGMDGHGDDSLPLLRAAARALAYAAPDQDAVSRARGVTALVPLLDVRDATVQRWAAQAVGTAALAHARNRAAVGASGGVAALVRCLSPRNADDVQRWAAVALTLVLRVPTTSGSGVGGGVAALQDAAREAGAMPALATCLEHAHNPDLQMWAAAALNALTVEHEGNRAAVRDAGALTRLRALLQSDHAHVRKSAQAALAIIQ